MLKCEKFLWTHVSFHFEVQPAMYFLFSVHMRKVRVFLLCKVQVFAVNLKKSHNVQTGLDMIEMDQAIILFELQLNNKC